MPGGSFKIGNVTYSGNSGDSSEFPKLAHKRTMIRVIPFILVNAVISIIYTIVLLYTQVRKTYYIHA